MLRLLRSVVIGALVGLVVVGPGVSGAGAQDQPDPQPPPGVIAPGVLEAAEAQGTVRVVAALVPGPLAETQAEVEDAVPAAEGDVVRTFATLPYTALELTPEGIVELANSGTVRSIGLDAVAHPELDTSVPHVNAPATWTAGFDGTGQKIAIIDTGVDNDHPDLSVVGEACFADDDGVADGPTGGCPNGQNTQTGTDSAVPCTGNGQCSHGTHVAGIAASHDAIYQGVAKGAGILSIQVYSVESGVINAWFSDIAAAIEYAAAHGASAANLSLSDGTQRTGNCTSIPGDPSRQAVVDAIAAATDDGMAVVAAAGNQAHTQGIAFPACTTDAIAVGNVSDPSDAVFSQSNSGPQLDIWAPGVSIQSTVPGGGFGFNTGTSMSTPHVAGAFALLHQADPGASVDLLRRRMLVNGPCIKDPRNQRRFHRLDVDASRTETFPLHTFTDVIPCAWEEQAVSWAQEEAIVTGFPDGTFQPSSSLNRGQATAWLWHFEDDPTSSTPHGFSDVPANAWYGDALDWAKEDGVVVGFNDGTYRPKDPVNRGQIVQWIWKALGSPAASSDHPFTDVPPGAWNEAALDWGAENGVVTGYSDGTYRPNDPVSRAQIAVMLNRVFLLP